MDSMEKRFDEHYRAFLGVDDRLADGETVFGCERRSRPILRSNHSPALATMLESRLAISTEPRFAATLHRIEKELVTDGPGVHRYRSDTYYGGGAWPVLTSAYGRVLLRRGGPGDVERALQALHWIEAQADARGELPEQVADHALAPERVDEWRELWGESARPLLWSHAAYLSLRTLVSVPRSSMSAATRSDLARVSMPPM